MTPNRVHTEQASRFSQARGGAAPSAAAVISTNGEDAVYELRFRSIFDQGRGYAFPCDAAGHVDLDALGERARINYFSARTLIGREFFMPAVQPGSLH